MMMMMIMMMMILIQHYLIVLNNFLTASVSRTLLVSLIIMPRTVVFLQSSVCLVDSTFSVITNYLPRFEMMLMSPVGGHTKPPHLVWGRSIDTSLASSTFLPDFFYFIIFAFPDYFCL